MVCEICSVELYKRKKYCLECQKFYKNTTHKGHYGTIIPKNKFKQLDIYEIGDKFKKEDVEWQIESIKNGLKKLYYCSRVLKNGNKLYETFDCFQIRDRKEF